LAPHRIDRVQHPVTYPHRNIHHGRPNFMFNFTDTQSPWDRLANFGFRCAKLDSPPTAAAAARLELTTRDFWKEKPVSDDVFKAYTALYAYDKGELNAQVEETATMEGWSRARVSFDAAYGHERVTAYLLLPKNASPPFQTVVYFPGVFALLDDKLDLSGVEETRSFLVKSGRARGAPTGGRAHDKKHVIYEGGHGAFPRPAAVRESLDWLDKYLGPVRR
jgi:hypothetical protein